jgi:hypothetical protein
MACVTIVGVNGNVNATWIDLFVQVEFYALERSHKARSQHRLEC